MNICTIIARNYVAHARVLAESFRATHPDGTCSVLVIDDPSNFFDAAAEPFDVLTLEEIGLPDPERMAASYDVLELSTAVKPWLLRHLLAKQETDSVIYLDPDIRIFGSLEEVERRAHLHHVVLTPHFTSPLPRDGRKPSEEDILIAGTYNLGFIALGRGKTTDSLLDWWSERLETHCIVNPEKGHFVDQRWIDLVPGLWPEIDIFTDPGFNLAYWNLPTHRFEVDGDVYRVDGVPLRFFHFSGFDPLRPDELSRHQNRIDVAPNPALSRICEDYAGELLKQGFEEAQGWPYGWDKMANGIRLDRTVRRLHREAVESGAITDSVFTPQGAEQFTAYLGGAPRRGRRSGEINRYVKALWDSRPDFRRHFPDVEGLSGPAFINWLRHTAGDTGISVELLPDVGTSGAALTLASTSARPEPGINVVGYLSSERGVGEVARQLVSALRAGKVPTAAIDTPADPHEIPDALGNLTDADQPYDFNLICVNADMLPAVTAGGGSRFLERRYSAGLWFWEVSRFPDIWHRSFDHVDEVWVGSEHIAQALRPISPIPVQAMQLPIAPEAPERLNRAELGMPEGFCFLFVFDYRSVFRRKNPIGVVDAFCNAFEPGSGASLVIKSICGDEFPAEWESLANAVRDRPDIHLLEDTVPTAVKNAMIANCDCYISLHRSEGLGLTMAEAMYFERPVIATGYSGNLDFMNNENSYLVPYKMVEIGADAPPYPAGGFWAEPDLERAATLMRQVFEQPDAAAERGRQAAFDIRRTHSPEACCAAIERRVGEVRRQHLISRLQPPLGAQAMPGGRERLGQQLRLGHAVAPHGSSRFRAMAKRLYMRLLRPYASYQERINTHTAESIDELREILSDALRFDGEAIDELRARQAETGATASMMGNLVQAARSKPFMSDDRLARRDHPVLGATIGFRTNSARPATKGYRRFEDLFRGSEQMIRDRQRVYLKLVADHAPVFDAGCGRGEFLDLLDEAGVEFLAVDHDPDMVERCREKGYESVERGDLLEFLDKVPAHSLGAIFSAQVVEHLEFDHLQCFLRLGLAKLQPGGMLIAETVNPHSAAALKTFWVDPTHVQPLFPETMLALCDLAGYARADVFAPLGSGDWERDRTNAGEYAVVAIAPESDV